MSVRRISGSRPGHGALRAVAALVSALALTASGTALSGGPAGAVAGPAAASSHQDISFHRYATVRDWARGTGDGAKAVGPTGLSIVSTAGTTSYADPFGYPVRTYDYARWTSPAYAPGFGLTELVSSWNATTPAGTWLQVEMRGQSSAGHETKWYVMGRWASGDSDIHRTSVDDQGDADGTISTDTFFARSGITLADYQLRVTLYRLSGSSARPVLHSLGAVASALPDDTSVPTSPLGGAEGIELPVPRYSQNVHEGQYPEYDGGGEAWCSPTSTAMVTQYWGKQPSAAELAWVDPSYADPQVDVAARGTFDYTYDGTGNWPFNVAYAAHYGLAGEVTQLRSLNEAEQFIKAGIPIITSVSFQSSELDGAGYSTDGHLMVIVGFTATGDVIANDPASHSDLVVRRVYKRAQFENVWLPASRSDGIVYLIHPVGRPLPRSIAGLPVNW